MTSALFSNAWAPHSVVGKSSLLLWLLSFKVPAGKVCSGRHIGCCCSATAALICSFELRACRPAADTCKKLPKYLLGYPTPPCKLKEHTKFVFGGIVVVFFRSPAQLGNSDVGSLWPILGFGVETRSACYRGPKPQKVPKVVRRVCKRCFGACGPKACCTGVREGCTGAKQGCTGARDSRETILPDGQNTFCTLSQ